MWGPRHLSRPPWRVRPWLRRFRPVPRRGQQRTPQEPALRAGCPTYPIRLARVGARAKLRRGVPAGGFLFFPRGLCWIGYVGQHGLVPRCQGGSRLLRLFVGRNLRGKVGLVSRPTPSLGPSRQGGTHGRLCCGGSLVSQYFQKVEVSARGLKLFGEVHNAPWIAK